jgi:hypothetical protein
MKRKEELYPVQAKGQVQDKMVKCYECNGEGRILGSMPDYMGGISGVIFYTCPVVCKHCQGFGEVPLYAQEQLSTLA